MKNTLLAWRQAKGLTQQELGEWVGVSRQTIISLEGGKYNPSLILAHKLAVFFQVPIEDLFVFDDEQVPSNDEQIRILS
ncbi:MAG TPA: helix-turn-helix transcriptional regulator [Treponemataceae bacterium]|nr:MAG: anaerobic benzoate catabolism transcriptional regulator [Spirochaetes bacterium ADurb.Bin269]HOC28592.1 helix-turn-helix transcriptional regulator [Treponemataceae bacterium]